MTRRPDRVIQRASFPRPSRKAMTGISRIAKMPEGDMTSPALKAS
jgi:hypothetical protein